MPQPNATTKQLLLDFPEQKDYTFDNFIVSKGSRFAWESCRALCSGSSVDFQTLYIAGGRGLGKTHLLKAMGHQAAKEFPEKQVVYLPGSEFMRRTVNSGDSGNQEILEQLVRSDLLLLDDVDCLAANVTAQEKLYFVYNALLEQKKKIAITGSRLPDDLKGTESFLTSRFQWGVTATLQPMDDQTTTRLIHQFSKDIQLALPDRLIEFILNRIPRDFPTIRKSILAINRESYLQKKKVTQRLVESALQIKTPKP